MVFPEGILDISKLTNPLEVRVPFLPISIYQVVLPPLLLDLQPSRDAVEVIVIDWLITVGVGVEVTVGLGVGVADGFLVGVGLLSGSWVGVGVEVAEAVGVGEVFSEDCLPLIPK
jgi:hypothetical protein